MGCRCDVRRTCARILVAEGRGNRECLEHLRDHAPTRNSDRSPAIARATAQKVRESIRDNIADIIAEESIIGKDRDRIIKVPIRGIKEYRFIYGDNAPGVGQGDGDTAARPGRRQGRQGRPGQRRRPGRRPPRHRLLRDRRHARRADRDHVRGSRAARPRAQALCARFHPIASLKRKGYRHVGIRIRLDKRRTARQRVMRILAARHRHAVEAERALKVADNAELEADTGADIGGARKTRRSGASRSTTTTCATATSRPIPRKSRTRS